MCAVRYYTGEPYRLAGSRIAFTSWHFVRPADFGWYDGAGANVSVKSYLGPDEAVFRRSDDPRGVRLVVHAAGRTGPLLRPERPWEAGGVGAGTLMRDGGVYRLWAESGWGDLRDRAENFFSCFESDDGFAWRRPEYGIVEQGGNRQNNLLDRLGGGVFVDPSASPAERYKWIANRHFDAKSYEEYRRKRPDGFDPKVNLSSPRVGGMGGAVSPDGLHWTVIPEPLLMVHTDTHVVGYYDEALERYVAYVREWAVGAQDAAALSQADRGLPRLWIGVGRRSIGRTESADFRSFPLSTPVVEPPPWMGPSQTLYTNCRTTIPGAPEAHLMFPTVWDQATDTTHLSLLASSDGVAWSFVSQEPLLRTAPHGAWDGGCIFAVPNLVELPNGDFVLPYTGFDVPHKYPRGKANRGIGYALWPKGRLAGIEAEESGCFSTVCVAPKAERLFVNAGTKRAGSLRFEIADLAGAPVAGREFAASVPLVGDCPRAPVRWATGDTLGVAPGTPIRVRVRMESAVIYWLEFA